MTTGKLTAHFQEFTQGVPLLFYLLVGHPDRNVCNIFVLEAKYAIIQVQNNANSFCKFMWETPHSGSLATIESVQWDTHIHTQIHSIHVYIHTCSFAYSFPYIHAHLHISCMLTLNTHRLLADWPYFNLILGWKFISYRHHSSHTYCHSNVNIAWSTLL